MLQDPSTNVIKSMPPLTVQPEVLVVIKFGGLAPNNAFHTIFWLKFGGMVRYRHTYTHAEKNLANFNLAV